MKLLKYSYGRSCFWNLIILACIRYYLPWYTYYAAASPLHSSPFLFKMNLIRLYEKNIIRPMLVVNKLNKFDLLEDEVIKVADDKFKSLRFRHTHYHEADLCNDREQLDQFIQQKGPQIMDTGSGAILAKILNRD